MKQNLHTVHTETTKNATFALVLVDYYSFDVQTCVQYDCYQGFSSVCRVISSASMISPTCALNPLHPVQVIQPISERLTNVISSEVIPKYLK